MKHSDIQQTLKEKSLDKHSLCRERITNFSISKAIPFMLLSILSITFIMQEFVLPNSLELSTIFLPILFISFCPEAPVQL